MFDDHELKKFLEGVVGVVEATHNEQHYLWERWTEKYGADWKSNLMGLGETVGFLADMPVCISLRTAVVNGRKILFIDPTSMVVDYRMINDWMQKKLPASARDPLDGRINKTDATNFHIVCPARVKIDAEI